MNAMALVAAVISAMQQGFFKDAAAAAGAHHNPAKLASLAEDDVFFRCVRCVLAARGRSICIGSMQPKSCGLG